MALGQEIYRDTVIQTSYCKATEGGAIHRVHTLLWEHAQRFLSQVGNAVQIHAPAYLQVVCLCSHILWYPSPTWRSRPRSPKVLYAYESLVAALARAPLGLVCLFKAEKALCSHLKPFSRGPGQELLFCVQEQSLLVDLLILTGWIGLVSLGIWGFQRDSSSS